MELLLSGQSMRRPCRVRYTSDSEVAVRARVPGCARKMQGDGSSMGFGVNVVYRALKLTLSRTYLLRSPAHTGLDLHYN